MNLLLWRHAEAEDGPDDMARCLTERGKSQARKMAKWLGSLPGFDEPLHVLASPAQRTLQTAAAYTDRFITVPELAPGADVMHILGAAGWPHDHANVLIVGHQPTLGRVASFLLSGQENNWSIKKGALWWLRSRMREEESQVVLRAVMSPELL